MESEHKHGDATRYNAIRHSTARHRHRHGRRRERERGRADEKGELEKSAVRGGRETEMAVA